MNEKTKNNELKYVQGGGNIAFPTALYYTL